MIDFTIAIPTYNGGKRLPDLFKCLEAQEFSLEFSWELIIIDNNSTDDTQKIVLAHQEKWEERIVLRYFLEKKQGAAFARLRAIQEAQGELVGFLDDDTYPNRKWIDEAYKFGLQHPDAGAYGSHISGIFECDPPKDFGRIKVFFAIIERGKEPHQYTRRKRMLPPSAGLVVRKKAWKSSVPKSPFLSGRTSKSVLTGEDTEVLAYIQMLGWEIWHNPKMKLIHKIPASRLERKSILPMVRGIGLARHHIRMVRTPKLLTPFVIPIYFCGDLWRLLVYFLKVRGTWKDIVVACEITFLLSTLLSPFYICKLYVFNAFSNKFLKFKP